MTSTSSNPQNFVPSFRVQLYADGAHLPTMLKRYASGEASGFTTNPSLMAKAGIRDYLGFAREALAAIPDRSISFEVFSDVFSEMEREARILAPLGPNVAVKIPIMNSKGESSIELIRSLLKDGISLNVTAIFTDEQLLDLHRVVRPQDRVIVSVFAGRMADTGVDPEPLMRNAAQLFLDKPGSKLLWASCREALNVVQADRTGCAIITVTDDVFDKIKSFGKTRFQGSLETVQAFVRDSASAGFKI